MLFFISVALTFSGALSFAELPARDSAQLNVNSNSDANASVQANTDATTAIVSELEKTWSDQQEKVAQDLLTLRTDVLERIAELEKTHTAAQINELIDTGFITASHPEIGSAKMTLVDGHRIIRAVPLKARTSYFFLKKDEINPLSAHLRKLVARTHIESDPNGIVYDENGDRTYSSWTGLAQTATGRDVVLVWLDDSDEIVAGNSLTKPKPTEPRWWSEYFYAKFKGISANEVTFGIASAVLQAVPTAVVCSIKAHAGQEAMNWMPVYTSLLFSSIVNSNLSSYRAWARQGPRRWVNTVKASSVSVAFNFVIVEADKGPLNGLHTMNFTTLSGASYDLGMLRNAYITNESKNAWMRAADYRTRERLNNGSVQFNLFGKKIEWGKANIETALLYLIPFTLKQIDILQFNNHPFAQGIGYPVGEALNLGYFWWLAKRPVSEKWPLDSSNKAKSYYENLLNLWSSKVGPQMPKALKDWTVEKWHAAETISAQSKTVFQNGMIKLKASCKTLFETDEFPLPKP